MNYREFPQSILKAEGGEDLLKGLKDLKVKLTENADIVQKYMEAVEKFLPGMTAMLGLTVSDFTVDKESLFDLRNNMLEGEYSPVVYRAEKDGGKYEAAIWILREACGFSVHFAVVKNKDGQSWMYNSDRQKCSFFCRNEPYFIQKRLSNYFLSI